MDDSDIGDEVLEQTILAARNGNRKALDALIFCQWTIELLNRIAGWASWRFSIDAELVRDHVLDTVRHRITELANSKQTSWTACFASWSCAIAKNYCLNLIRHEGVVDAHRGSVVHENTHAIRNGNKIMAHGSTSLSREEELELEEAVQLWASRQLDLRSRVRRVITCFPPEYVKITELWANGNTLKEIAEERETSIETARRKLKEVQKAVIAEIASQDILIQNDGPKPVLKVQPEFVNGFRQLIANSLRGICQLGYVENRRGPI